MFLLIAKERNMVLKHRDFKDTLNSHLENSALVNFFNA